MAAWIIFSVNFAIGDVAYDREKMRLTVDVDFFCRNQTGDESSGLGAENGLPVMGETLFEDFAQKNLTLIQVFPDLDVEHRPADHLSPVITGIGFEACVDIDDNAVFDPGDNNCVRAGLEHGPEKGGILLQRLLGQPAFLYLTLQLIMHFIECTVIIRFLLQETLEADCDQHSQQKANNDASPHKPSKKLHVSLKKKVDRSFHTVQSF